VSERVSPIDAARLWVDGWTTGWTNHDPEPIAARYADGCTLLSHPFRASEHGRDHVREYGRQAFADEDTSDFVFREPIVSSDGRAAVEYRAVITATDGTVATLAGTTILRFDDAGFVVEHRDYWALTNGDLGLAGSESKENFR
jgi:ketosteroid isomerase-like protein